jgi:hypothetical protein
MSASCHTASVDTESLDVRSTKTLNTRPLTGRSLLAFQTRGQACASNVTDWRSTAASFLRFRRPALPLAASSEAAWPSQQAARQASRQIRRGRQRKIRDRPSGLRGGALQAARPGGQRATPWASIVTCSDSRVPPELLFGGMGLGELFVARNAGNGRYRDNGNARIRRRASGRSADCRHGS